MTFNIKTLGRVLVAVFALSAVAVSSASAAQFTVSPGTILTAPQLPTAVTTFTGDSGQVICQKAMYPGVVAEEVTEGGAKDVVFTLSPEIEGCEGLESETAVDPTGCDIVLYPTGTLDIKCPTGKNIDIKEAELCEITVRPQKAVPKVTYTKDPEDAKSIIVDISSEGIQYEEHGLFCASQNKLTKNGSFQSQITVKGEDTKGKQVSITFDP